MASLADFIMQGIFPDRPDLSISDKMYEYFSRFSMGSGTPEGHVAAYVGSQYVDILTGNVYAKRTGAGTNTGWEVTPDSSDVTAAIAVALASANSTATSLVQSATDKKFLTAADFVAVTGSPVLTSSYTSSSTDNSIKAWLMDGAAAETVVTATVVPSNWTEFAVDCYWGNTTTTVGNVAWVLHNNQGLSNGDNIGVSNQAAQVVGAAPIVVGQLRVTTVATGLVPVAGELNQFGIKRNAGDALDTLDSIDCAMLGLMLRRTA